jgi:hypothetical protein
MFMYGIPVIPSCYSLFRLLELALILADSSEQHMSATTWEKIVVGTMD